MIISFSSHDGAGYNDEQCSMQARRTFWDDNSGTIRLTMNFDRFVKPVSAIAIGPAITAAMLYFPPGDDF